MGNKLGWIIAGAIVVLLIVVLLVTVVFPSKSGPSLEVVRPGVLDFHDVEVPISTITGNEPSGSGNAADDYAQAVPLTKDVEPGDKSLDLLNRIDTLVAAGNQKKEMKYLLVHTPKKMEVRTKVPELEDLQNVGGALDILGRHYMEKKEYDQARKVYGHLLVLGWHMVGERSHMDMVDRGMGLSRIAADALSDIAEAKGDKALADVCTRYKTGLDRMTDAYRVKLQLIWKPHPLPGDIFYIIENDKDRACRIQAILALGIVKFTCSQRGDLKYVQKLITDLVASPDPVVAAAATAAKDLTKEDFNQLGSM